jgi:hypothetical protein
MPTGEECLVACLETEPGGASTIAIRGIAAIDDEYFPTGDGASREM